MIPVFVSRPGLICCAGPNAGTFFDAALRGDRRGIVTVTVPGAPAARPFLAGRIAGLPGSLPGTRLTDIVQAALEQLRPQAAKAADRWGADRVAVCAGSCDNGSEWSLPAHRVYFDRGAFPPDYDLRLQSASGPAEYAARMLGLSGPVLGIATACASSATAIIRAAEMIRAGVCDAALAGGADLASDTVLLGFSALEAVSPEPSNPFSKNRKGVNLGEGAAFFMLSREPLEEGPAIQLSGYGESADAHHITAPHPQGKGAAKAMEDAIARAGIGPEDIGYVNLHGTGTPLNDRMEAQAMAVVFGAAPPPASSTKPVTGHTLGAAGALELALCRMVLETAAEDTESAAGKSGGIPLPVHCWDGIRDEELPPLRLAGPADRGTKIRYCMSNSFAFGGCNVSLVLGREAASHG
jgi:3-oxoacyl-[acyl-carrier-protein] synthase-1